MMPKYRHDADISAFPRFSILGFRTRRIKKVLIKIR
jgi:hypothetical protein